MIRVQFYFIFIFLFDPSWSESIRVDPTRTGGPSLSGPTFEPAWIKKSTRFKDAYITADYAKAIQDDRRMLIKAMFKAKEQGSEAKVVGRYLYKGELIKYDVTNIPEDFK